MYSSIVLVPLHQSAAVGAVVPPSSKLALGKMPAFGAGDNIGDNPSPMPHLRNIGGFQAKKNRFDLEIGISSNGLVENVF